jgi:hypothetical protein
MRNKLEEHHSDTLIRIRRVKCGEEKPACLRCIKFGISCDGYRTSSDIDFPHDIPQPKRYLLPKSQRPPQLAIPSSSRFGSEQESRYFDVFCSKTAFEIFPSFEKARLRRIFLQAAESEPSIRHAVIALGALDQTSQTAQNQKLGLLPCGGYVDDANQHYRNTVKAYTRAIKHMQAAGSLGKQDLRTTLLTCLFILSFEGWKGNHNLAVQQIRTGTGLLKEWKEGYKNPTKLAFPPPAPDIVEGVLIHVFARLSIQLVSSAAERSPGSYSKLDTCGWDLVNNMPRVFGTLEEAENFQNLIVRLLVQFLSKGQLPIPRIGTYVRTYPVNVFWEIMSLDVACEQETLLQIMVRWLDAFAALKNHLDKENREVKETSITLELQMKAAYISAVTACVKDQTAFDSFNGFYNDIVNLSDALLSDSQPHTTANTPLFCIDTRVVATLWSVGHKCREKSIRQRAILLLLDFPRRDGVWESGLAGRTIECVMNFEEEYMKSGYIPGWARIRYITFQPDLEQRTAVVKYQ